MQQLQRHYLFPRTINFIQILQFQTLWNFNKRTVKKIINRYNHEHSSITLRFGERIDVVWNVKMYIKFNLLRTWKILFTKIQEFLIKKRHEQILGGKNRI